MQRARRTHAHRDVSCGPLLFDANAGLASLKRAAYKPKSLAVWRMRWAIFTPKGQLRSQRWHPMQSSA